jgi:hyaluronoglucosaminidase
MLKKHISCILIALAAIFFCVSADAYVLLPTPQKILKQGAPVKIDARKVVVSAAIGAHDPRVLKGLKEIFPALTVGKRPASPAPGSVYIHVAEKADDFANKTFPDLKCWGADPAAFGPQEYFLGIRKSGGALDVLILFKHAHTENGVSEYYGEYYATRTIKQLFENDTLPEIAILDWPDFQVRGVLEGFYGKPWLKQPRLAMLPWMGDYKFNIYLYTPKDDNKLRLGWRVSLSEKELAEVKNINDLAADHFVKYCWSLSPGMSINFSSDKDMKAAYRKYKSVLEVGVRCFTIAFDDVGPVLSPTDRGKFATYWEGQVAFTNRVVGKLLEEYPDATFAFVPNDYWGNLARESESLRYLGAHLDQRISIGFTGSKIIPDTVTPADAQLYTYYIKRQPFLGDNYPVTDNITLAGGRLSLGPLRGRDARLFRYVRGFAANASPLPETSKPAFLTIADYTWNPFAYDETRSWINTCKIIAGGKYETFDFFSKQSESSFIWKYDAMDLFEQTRAALMAYQKKPDYDMKASAAALNKTFARFAGIDKEIESIRNPGNSAMLDEMKLWIQKLKMYGDVGLKVVAMLDRSYTGEKVSAVEIDAVEAEWKKGEENKAVMTEMVGSNFILQSLALLRGQALPAPEKLKTLMSDE